MFIHVKLLNGFNQPLIYEAPAHWPLLPNGTIIQVPLKDRVCSAVIIQTDEKKPAHITFSIKKAIGLDPFPADSTYLPFLKKLSGYYQIDYLSFLRRMRACITEKQEDITPPNDQGHDTQEVMLTDEQQSVVDFLIPHITQPAYTPTVLHGVTGSGKTEVYKHLITHTHAQHKTTILMFPEITLALQFEKKLRAQLSTAIPIFSFHSGSSVKNKKALWQALLANTPVLIIGVHMPILLPINNLGIIIIDEEHETGYQEKKHPKINSKEAALIRAQASNIPILLGSATPSIPSLYNVHHKGWHFFSLKRRFAGAFPTIKTVFLTDKKQRKSFWISRELELAIKDRLIKKEQVIIFLNRRGFSFFVQCKMCSFIFECHHCSVSLTLHENNQLTCHYCTYHITLPKACPSCQVDESNLLKKGIGTQQIVTIIQKMFPQARIARADLDTTVKKKAWQCTMQDFEAGAIDILVGTQTITKGYHFPKVTLVGIVWADLNLHFPVYNAAETTLQQIIQVAGRAGRATMDSMVIVQAMIDHPIFGYLNEVDYLDFFDQQIEFRSMVGYPPCLRLAEIEVRCDHEQTVEEEALHIAHVFHAYNEIHHTDISVLGPAKPPVHKIKNHYARKIYIKSADISLLIKVYQSLNIKKYRSTVFFTPNPNN